MQVSHGGIKTSSNLSMSYKQKVRASSFQVKILWLEYFMDGAVYFTSCHTVTLRVAKISQPIQVMAAPSFHIFKFIINLSPSAMVSNVGCTLQSPGMG